MIKGAIKGMLQAVGMLLFGSSVGVGVVLVLETFGSVGFFATIGVLYIAWGAYLGATGKL